MKKRTIKEAEELISKLRLQLGEKERLLVKMRMGLYYAKKSIDEVDCEIDGMWCHHQDGSDLIVSQNELFDVHQNKIRRELIVKAKNSIDKPLLELKKFIGW